MGVDCRYEIWILGLFLGYIYCSHDRCNAKVAVYRESISCIHGDRHVVVDHYAVCYSSAFSRLGVPI